MGRVLAGGARRGVPVTLDAALASLDGERVRELDRAVPTRDCDGELRPAGCGLIPVYSGEVLAGTCGGLHSIEVERL